MFIQDWMSTPVVAIAAGASVLDALRLMEARSVRRLPVLEGEALRGIVAREDLHARLGYGEGLAREAEAAIDGAMRFPVWTVSPRDTLEHAAQTMLERDVSGLPVLEEGRLVGMITESDVFRAFTKILGVGEAGARVVLSLAPGSDLMEELRRRSAGLAIRSLTATPRDGGWEVVMRLRGRAAVPAV